MIRPAMKVNEVNRIDTQELYAVQDNETWPLTYFIVLGQTLLMLQALL